MFKQNSKKFVLLGAVLILAIGGVAAYTLYKNQPQEKAKAAEVTEVQKKVEESPEAGIEVLDKASLDSIKKSIEVYPSFIVKGEIERQYNEKFITKKQRDQIMQMLEDKEKGQPSSSSESSQNSPKVM